MVPFQPSAKATGLLACVATCALLAVIPLQNALQHNTSALGFALPATSHQAAGPSTNDVVVHALAAAQQQQQRKSAGTAWLLSANPLAVVAIVTALAFSATRSSSRSGRNGGFIQRRAVYNSFKRPGKEVITPYNGALPYPLPKNHWPGTRGYRTDSAPMDKHKKPKDARMTLSDIFDADAMLKFTLPQSFEEPAELNFENVKEVGSCTVSRGDEGLSISAPASPPAYVRPTIGYRLEQEKGPKRPPVEDEQYQKYFERRRSLVESVSKVGLSMKYDVISDRSSLLVLMRYITGELGKTLKIACMPGRSADLVKISKVPGSDALIFEALYQGKNLRAEKMPYRGRWMRSEVSNYGNYAPAWQRLATGDTKTCCYMVTGLKLIAGKRAGIPPKQYRFVEHTLGGLSFLTRTETHANLDGKSVELATRNWYHRENYTLLNAYTSMLLGGVDITGVAIHRSGKVTDVLDVTVEDILKRLPELKEAAEHRFGYLAKMIKQVKAAIEESSDDGPWVLQWHKDEVLLGKYQVPTKEEEEEKEMEVELDLEVDA